MSMPDAFNNLNKFYKAESERPISAMMGASLSFNIRPKQRPTAVELFMSSYLAGHLERFRDSSRNTLRGFVVSTPQSRADTFMLGLTYLDGKDGSFDEDLFEASHSGLRRMRKT